jgi:hypothetical protein
VLSLLPPQLVFPDLPSYIHHWVVNLTCLIQDRTGLPEKYKDKLMKYLTDCLKIVSRDSETCLTYNWIQVSIL